MIVLRIVLLLVMSAAGSVPLAAQANLTFEVASVRPNTSSQSAASFQFTPSGLTITNVTLFRLIETAYGVQGFTIKGGPAWVHSDRFDVIAKAATAVSRDQLTDMLRSLLAERFGLRVRHDTVEGRTYQLIRSRPALGPQLRASTVDCSSESTPQVRQNPNLCGLKYGFDSITARSTSLEALAALAASLLRTPVIDQTGLKGAFDCDLRYNRSGAPDLPHPSIFTALDEQLGLKLQEQPGPVQMLIIEQVGALVPD